MSEKTVHQLSAVHCRFDLRPYILYTEANQRSRRGPGNLRTFSREDSRQNSQKVNYPRGQERIATI